MPEGPEIRRAADSIERALKNKTIQDVFFAFPHLEDYEDLLKGAVVTRVDTKGKAMLIRFDNGYTIYSHNQLYGKWMIRNLYNYPNTNRQLRLALHNEKNRRFFTVHPTLKSSVTKKSPVTILWPKWVLIF